MSKVFLPNGERNEYNLYWTKETLFVSVAKHLAVEGAACLSVMHY